MSDIDETISPLGQKLNNPISWLLLESHCEDTVSLLYNILLSLIGYRSFSHFISCELHIICIICDSMLQYVHYSFVLHSFILNISLIVSNVSNEIKV